MVVARLWVQAVVSPGLLLRIRGWQREEAMFRRFAGGGTRPKIAGKREYRLERVTTAPRFALDYKLAWVKWNQVMAKREAGGLGIGSLVIKIFYGSNGGFLTNRRLAVGGSPWSRILAAADKLHRVEVVPRSTLRRRIGDGADTRFWEDCWVGGMLEDVRCTDSRDTWSWDISQDGVFTVAETKRWIDDLVLPVGTVQIRWCPLVPRKVNIFIWRLIIDTLPTRERLSSRGMEIQSIICPVCGMASEQLVHLFCRYELAVTLWEGVFRWLQIPAFGAFDLKEIFVWVDGSWLRSNQKKALEVITKRQNGGVR
ncbi:hypothetical protein LXL04_022799 [Taraxacum kok-saghyz]